MRWKGARGVTHRWGMTRRTRSTVAIVAVGGFVLTTGVVQLATSPGGLDGWPESVNLGLSVAAVSVLVGSLVGRREPTSSEFSPRELADIDPKWRRWALRVIRSGRGVTAEEASAIRPVAESTGRVSARTFPTAIGIGLLALARLLDSAGVWSVVAPATLAFCLVTSLWVLRDRYRCSEFLDRSADPNLGLRAR